jgi:hypothetical protein
MRARASAAKDCPVARPGRRTTQARALHLACEVLGGVAQLAAHLSVSEAALRAWVEGTEEPPASAFLAAVEIILLDAERGAAKAS